MRFERQRLLMGVAAIAGMVLFSLVPAYAQSTKLKVNIPFEFHAGEATLPSGMYVVERIGAAIRISDGKGHSGAVLSNAIANKSFGLKDQLVFKRYGRDSFLSEVRWSGYSAARGVATSAAERRLAKAITAEPVTVAAATR
jgi:hypothetical protein